jgi:prolyl oligopeptidase
MRRTSLYLLITTLAVMASLRSRGADTGGLPPVARRTDVVEERFGLRVADPYRWMEGGDNAEFQAWLRSQGAYTAQRLAQPSVRAVLYARIRALGMAASAIDDPQLAGGRTFYLRTAAGALLPALVMREADGRERVLVDPGTLGAGEKGGHYSIDNFAPSPDGKRVAYNQASGGGEVTRVHVLDVDSGSELPDVLDRIWGEFPVWWLPDGNGFFYTQMAPPAVGADPMVNMSARLHRLGTPVERDPVVLGRGVGGAMRFAPEEFPKVQVARGTRWLLALATGAQSERRVSVAPLAELDASGAGGTAWRRVAELEDGVEYFVIHGDRLYVTSHKDAPNRRLLSVPLARPDLASARIELPEETDAVLRGFAAARDALYLRDMVGGRARVRRMPWGSGKAVTLPLPFEGWVDTLAADPERDGVIIQMVGWARPAALFSYDAAASSFRPTGVAGSVISDPASTIAEEVEVPSADGETVPLSILHATALPLGSHPTIVYGYGGYGESLTPWFNPTRQAWLERGGVYAVCHVRGGGEKGHRWQQGGSRGHKMNSVRDFIACGQYLVSHGYTSPSSMAAWGGSMGGILIGRVITDRPDLFAAAVINVGLVNPLREQQGPNGANQNVELGTPDTADGFRALYEMDPYLHVKEGVAYPAVLLTVGLNDGRVATWMTGKFAARLQAATTGRGPILIRVEEDAGHGIGSSRDQRYAEAADSYGFLLAQFQARGLAATARNPR